jgi:hypothetical protein
MTSHKFIYAAYGKLKAVKYQWLSLRKVLVYNTSVYPKSDENTNK